MESGNAKRISIFIAVSYLLAFLIDLLSFYGMLPSIIWGFTRMWSVTLSTILCLIIFEGSIFKLRSFLKFSVKLLKLYLLSPLLVYAALGIYVAVTAPLGLFDFSAYIDLVAKSLAESLRVSAEEVAYLASILAYAQLALAYIFAVTLNAIFALGEELGWRGYLYALLGSKPTLKTTIIIGSVWGLWHTPAIILLGYNYQFNRFIGIPLFTALATLFAYPQILITDKAGGSVLPSSAFHGAINAIWGLTLTSTRLPMEIREIMLGLGIMGIVAWTILDLLLYIVKMHAEL